MIGKLLYLIGSIIPLHRLSSIESENTWRLNRITSALVTIADEAVDPPYYPETTALTSLPWEYSNWPV